MFFFNAASFLAVIAVLARLSKTMPPAAPGAQHAQAPGWAPGQAAAQAAARRFRWLADLPAPVRAAVVMALLAAGSPGSPTC